MKTKVTTLEAKVSEADKKRTDIAFGELDGNDGDNKLNCLLYTSRCV